MALRDNVETCHSLMSLDSLANLMSWLGILALDNLGWNFPGATFPRWQTVGIDSFGISLKNKGDQVYNAPKVFELSSTFLELKVSRQLQRHSSQFQRFGHGFFA
jgi:hypothetical protein